MTHWWNGMYVKPSSSSSSSSYASWGWIGVSWSCSSWASSFFFLGVFRVSWSWSCSCSSSSSFFFIGVFRVSWSSSPSSSSSWVYQVSWPCSSWPSSSSSWLYSGFINNTNHHHLFCHEFYFALMIILIIIFFVGLLRFHNHANHHLLHVNLAKVYLPKKFKCQKDGNSWGRKIHGKSNLNLQKTKSVTNNKKLIIEIFNSTTQLQITSQQWEWEVGPEGGGCFCMEPSQEFCTMSPKLQELLYKKQKYQKAKCSFSLTQQKQHSTKESWLQLTASNTFVPYLQSC